jgi:hypothetical protein
MQEKLPLEVYFCLDIGNNQDIELITKSLRVCIETRLQQYHLTRLEKIHVTDVRWPNDSDIIKNGLNCLTKMYDALKEKAADTFWFIYVGVGDVKTIRPNVTLILLNKDPLQRECFYTIHKTPLCVDLQLQKDEKLEALKVFTKSVQNVFTTKQPIKYTNFCL